jgi:hypothetical protein
MVVLKTILIGVFALVGLLGLGFALQSLRHPYVYQKDFIQEYLLAKAVLRGIDPYLPLPELADEILGPLPNLILQHPTPHPPPVALISLPLGLLTYEQAAGVWLAFEAVCIVIAVRLLLGWLVDRPGWKLTLAASLLVMAWSPFWEELVTGQLMALLLVLLIGAWQALRSGHAVKGGVLLGCSVALKLIAWPLVIWLALRKNWRAVGAAGVTLAVSNLLAAGLMGFERVWTFYLNVGGDVSALYRAYEYNFSLWSVGWRIFAGAGSTVVAGIEARPLIDAPDVAPWVSWIIPAVVLIIGLWWAIHAQRFDTSFAILLCVSILVSPVAWRHYLVLLAIPIVVVGRDLDALDWPERPTYAAIFLGVLLFIPRRRLHDMILWLAGQGPATETPPRVAFGAGLFSLLPALAICGLAWLVWRLRYARPEEA